MIERRTAARSVAQRERGGHLDLQALSEICAADEVAMNWQSLFPAGATQ
jgi:hypothetical protein